MQYLENLHIWILDTWPRIDLEILQFATTADILKTGVPRLVWHYPSAVQKYNKDEFVAYNSDQGLDSFLYGCIGEKPEYSKLWLILSNGQSCVERGFSDNKDILSNNMQDQTLISYRMAYDGIKNPKS